MRLDVPLCTSASHLPCTDSISGIFEAFVLIEFLKKLYINPIYEIIALLDENLTNLYVRLRLICLALIPYLEFLKNYM